MQRLGLVLRVIGALAVALACAGAAPAPSSHVQILLLESKRSLGDGQLALFLMSPDTRTAVRAALAIGRTKLPAGEPLLAAHLKDSRDAVRAVAHVQCLEARPEPGGLLTTIQLLWRLPFEIPKFPLYAKSHPTQLRQMKTCCSGGSEHAWQAGRCASHAFP